MTLVDLQEAISEKLEGGFAKLAEGLLTFEELVEEDANLLTVQFAQDQSVEVVEWGWWAIIG